MTQATFTSSNATMKAMMEWKAAISKHTNQTNNAAMNGLKQMEGLLQPQHPTTTPEALTKPNSMSVSFSDQPTLRVTYNLHPRIPMSAPPRGISPKHQPS